MTTWTARGSPWSSRRPTGARRSIYKRRRSHVSELNLVFGALADPNRRQVIGYLSERETATATELTGELPMTRQAVAKHLAALADAGLVESERQGRETRYRLTEAGAEWDDRLDALVKHLERHRK
jgi:DNA-binding transcriptional ArsR family regulator